MGVVGMIFKSIGIDGCLEVEYVVFGLFKGLVGL